jgi:hypothetical protein
MANADRASWHTHPLLITAAAAVIAGFFGLAGIAMGKWLEKEDNKTQSVLPIAANPSFKVAGVWLVDYWETTAYQGVAGGTTPIRVIKTNASPVPFRARIDISKVEGPRVSGYASLKSRTWAIEGYVDGSSLLYIYKDTLNPSSFGSAVIRLESNPDALSGIWAGVSPTFAVRPSKETAGPLLVGGYVRWHRE